MEVKRSMEYFPYNLFLRHRNSEIISCQMFYDNTYIKSYPEL